jgi:hypothetical protein
VKLCDTSFTLEMTALFEWFMAYASADSAPEDSVGLQWPAGLRCIARASRKFSPDLSLAFLDARASEPSENSTSEL